MKSFALALFVGAATAQNWGGYGGNYGHATNPWEAQHAQQQKQAGHNPWNSHQHVHQQQPTKPEGWYSAHQQYSPPKIPFIPVKLHKTTYGICQIEDDNMISTTINIGQSPGYPAMIKGTIAGADLSPYNGEVWSLDVMKFGNISGVDCAATGPEFNPLAEFIYGQPNPFADPSRGTINDVTIVAADATVMSQDFMQSKFMQNLGGKNSIIGKSIKVSTMRVPMGMTDPEAVVIGCCVIGQADNPAPPAPPAAPVVPAKPTMPTHSHGHHHHQPSYPGYGQYNRSHYRQPTPRYGGYGGGPNPGYNHGYNPGYGRGW